MLKYEDETTKKKRFSKHVVLVVLSVTIVSLVVISLATTLVWFKHGEHFHVRRKPSNNAEKYKHGVVTTDNLKCAEVGSNVLKEKGSAVDAAIASSFCVGVYSAHSAGIGGGGVMLVYNRELKKMESFDYREVAPEKATIDMLDDDIVKQRNIKGGLSIGVPGVVKGLYVVYQKYGKLPWQRLLEPAIKIAESGFYLGDRLQIILENKQKMLQNDTGLREMFFKENKLKDLGQKIFNKKLADTLRRISTNPNDFYYGSLALDVVEDIKSIGGIITLNDLLQYKIVQRELFTTDFNNLKMYTTTAPAGGPIVALMLNILRGFKFTQDDLNNQDKSIQTYHRVIEAMKFAFAQRTKIGDPAFFDKEYIKQWLTNMTSREVAESYRKKIDNKTYDFQHYGAINDLNIDHGTSHINVYSSNGDAVALTTSINNWFGSGFRSTKTGIIYNDQMRDFSKSNEIGRSGLHLSPYNFIAPFKRPVSSFSPCILLDKDGNVKIVMGAAGGLKIIPTIVQGLLFFSTFGDDLGKAVTRPRVYISVNGDTVLGEVDRSLPKPVIDGLKRMGHDVKMKIKIQKADLQGIYVKESGEIYAKVEPSRFGSTAGYR